MVTDRYTKAGCTSALESLTRTRELASHRKQSAVIALEKAQQDVEAWSTLLAHTDMTIAEVRERRDALISRENNQ